jgi:cytochrome c biogenesis protein CcdA/thiol-disulfide isomerase/thioredoxin
MILLVLFAFLAGIVTILSPCILPVLPIVLSGSVGGGKKKPLGIVIGFIASFTFFTLALSELVKLTGISSNLLRTLSIIIIAFFGLSLLIPKFQVWMEKLFGSLSSRISGSQQKSGFLGGIVLGLSLGLLWTPCVGPILASVIALAASNAVTFASVAIMLAYAVGTAIPMFLILITGRSVLNKVPGLVAQTANIQKFFGVVMVAVALSMFLNLDRSFQTFILTTFPQYGNGVTAIENNSIVQKELGNLKPNNAGTGGLTQILKNLNAYPTAPELIAGGQWFNSQPLTMASLRGKVVIVDFWTYTCINCIRTLPYLETWYKKYADKGLVIIGVHTPEFEFEKDSGNVAKAIKDFGITYPVMQDNNYVTWNAYSNQYWPAKYFIDKDGKIRDTHFGEGNYDESEKLIQQLLTETGVNVGNMPVDNPTYNIEAQTPETYVGAGKMERFESPETVVPDREMTYSTPSTLDQDNFAFSGPWTVSSDQAVPKSGSELTFRFSAKDLYLVMRSADGKPRSLKVFLDGKPVTPDVAGSDVKNDVVTVVEDRLYTLISLPAAGVHTLKIQFIDNNLQLYAFTFG